MNGTLDLATQSQLLTAQRNEITEYHIYTHLASRVRDWHIESDEERLEYVGSIVLGLITGISYLVRIFRALEV